MNTRVTVRLTIVIGWIYFTIETKLKRSFSMQKFVKNIGGFQTYL